MMTYIEQCGWCSSLISTTMRPSNVSKSTKPCPILSSSLASTSLISNGDSISISTNSISSSSASSTSLSYGKKKKILTFRERSSSRQSNDYYTTKRIEELHERMDDIQINSFLQFINHHLSLKKTNGNIHINDLAKDLANGHVLIDLIEILSSTKLKRERGHTRFHSLTNVQYVLDYLKSRMQHINISPHEIVSGNRKQTLALLWIIMKTFDFPGFRITNKNCFVENTLLGFGQDRSIIIKWLNNILNQSLNTVQTYINDFYLQTWINGYYLSIIIKYLVPLSMRYITEKCFDYLKELDDSNPYDEQRCRLCINLSNYCFSTVTIIDYTDKSERCLFKYFTELQQNILNILKTNHIGKLIQNNPYTKQILNTVTQTTTTTTTTGQSSHLINNNEQYLIPIESVNQQMSTVEHSKLTMKSLGHLSLSVNDTSESTNLRTVEKSRLFTDQQKERAKRRNRWDEPKTLESTSQVTNDHGVTSNDALTSKSQQLNGVVEDTQSPISSVSKVEPSTITILEDLQESPSAVHPTDIIDEKTQQITLPNVEQHLSESFERPTVEVQQSISSKEDGKQHINDHEASEEIKNEFSSVTNEELQILAETHEENKQSSDEYEKSTQNEESKQSIENALSSINIEQATLDVKAEINPSKPTVSTTTQPSIDISKQSEEIQQPLTSSKDDKKTKIEYAQSAVNEPSTSPIERLINEESVQPKCPETVTTLIHTDEASSQMEQNPRKNHKKSSSNKKNKKHLAKHIDTKPADISNEKVSQSTIEHKEVDQFIVINSTKSDKPLEQSTIIESLQSVTSDETNSSNKNLEKLTIIGSQQKQQQALASNGEINKSLITNKKSTQITSPNIENQSSSTSNKQSTIVVKEPEQRKSTTDQPMQTLVTTSNGDKYSDMINTQPVKINIESVQTKVPLDKQEHSNVSKKKAISSPMSLDQSKQTLKTTEETEQIPFKNITKQSEVSLEPHEQSITEKEVSSTSVTSNGETKKSSTKNKRSEKEKIIQTTPILSPPVRPEVQNPPVISSNDKSFNQDENLQHSSAFRSRKSKKKRTIATTTTTLIEKHSSPSVSIPITSNRNLFVTIQECLRDRKIIAFKCVFILACLCFSIIIIVLSHK